MSGRLSKPDPCCMTWTGVLSRGPGLSDSVLRFRGFSFIGHKQCKDFSSCWTTAQTISYLWRRSKNISTGNFLRNSQIGGALTPPLPLWPGTPPVSSPSTMSFDLCGAVNAADQPHDRPYSHPVRWPTICHRGPETLGGKGPNPPPPLHLSAPHSPPPRAH